MKRKTILALLKKHSRMIGMVAVIMVFALTVGFMVNRVGSGIFRETSPPDNKPAVPAGLENEVYKFIPYHHTRNIFMNNDELKPEINTLYAIWRTFQFETALAEGRQFPFDMHEYQYVISGDMVKNVVSYLYDLDGYSVEYDDFYKYKDNNFDPLYFLLPDGFSPDTVWAFAQWDTLTVKGGICKFDVIFYEVPMDDSDRGDELCTFNYEFEQVIYKDKIICYRFIGATRVK